MISGARRAVSDAQLGCKMARTGPNNKRMSERDAQTKPSAPPPRPPAATPQPARKPREIGGPKGPEPTRYGDWEKGGRCIDF